MVFLAELQLLEEQQILLLHFRHQWQQLVRQQVIYLS
jgi:hypothetical protein